MKFPRLMFFFALLLSINFRTLCAKDSLNTLKSISIEGKEDLNRLFHELFNVDGFAYTLFGDKPVSFASFFDLTPWENTIELGECCGVMLKKWELWKKYQNNFKINNYLLIQEQRNGIQEIIFINKKAFIKVVTQEINVFQNILQRKIDPAEILEDIEKGRISFHELINGNNFLLGILLGYGPHNAMLYAQRGKIFKNDCLDYFGSYKKSMQRIRPIHFMADLNSEETKELEKKYQALRGMLSKIYANGNFFETSLFHLTR